MVVTNHAQERIAERCGAKVTKDLIGSLAKLAKPVSSDKRRIGIFGKYMEIVVRNDTVITAYEKRGVKW